MNTDYNKLSYDELLNRVKELDVIYSCLPGGIVIADADPDFTMTYANKGYYELVGYTPEEINELYQNKGILTLHPEDKDDAIESFFEQTSKGDSFIIKAKLINKTHGYIWVHFSGRCCKMVDGSVKIYILIVDITEHLLLMEQLKHEQEYNNLIFNLTNDVFFDYDIKSSKIKYTSNFTQRFNIPEIIEDYPKSIIDSGIVSEESLDVFTNLVYGNKYEDLASYNGREIKLIQPNGDTVWYSVNYNVQVNSLGVPYRIIGKLTDITKQKERIANLTKKAELDPLTKLLNKEEAEERIEKYLSEHTHKTKSALFIIDIDNFKRVNDTLGHQFGDSVLKDIAQKIKGIFRKDDIIGRLGGDEFVVLMQDISAESVIKDKADSLTDAFRHTFSGDKNEYKISASIGIAVCPDHGTSFNELYPLADSALYNSKKRGKDCYTVYSDTIKECVMSNKTPLEDAARFVASYYADDPIYNIFEMLYETKDMYTTLNKVVSIIGRRFDVDRCYIFEHSEDGKYISKTYEWCAEGVMSQANFTQNLPLDKMGFMFSHYNQDGIFYCNDIADLDEKTYEFFREQNINSVIHCAFYKKGEMRGFIGFDKCNDYRVWLGEEIAMLNYISKILSVFL